MDKYRAKKRKKLFVFYSMNSNFDIYFSKRVDKSDIIFHCLLITNKILLKLDNNNNNNSQKSL